MHTIWVRRIAGVSRKGDSGFVNNGFERSEVYYGHNLCHECGETL